MSINPLGGIVIYIIIIYTMCICVDFIESFDDGNSTELLLLGHLFNGESWMPI